MRIKSSKPARKTPTSDKTIAAHAKETVGNLTAHRFASPGRSARVQGHVSSRNKRTQAKRDSR